MIAVWLAVCLAATPPLTHDEAAQVYVESRGSTLAVSRAGARGLTQVTAIGWSAAGREWGIPPALDGAWARLHVLAHLPIVGVLAGRAVLRRWRRRADRVCAGGRCDPADRAIRAYACGTSGLRGRCGGAYARRVATARKSAVIQRRCNYFHLM